MSDRSQERLDAVFATVYSRPREQWASALDELCVGQGTLRAEVQSLLSAADVPRGFLSVSPAIRAQMHAGVEAWLGRQVGPYRVVRELGSGGMGTVFLAQRSDGEYQQQVALKLVNAHADAELITRRFKAERQILATLEHPNIARLLDGGTTEDGRPYLVMEYVRGQPVDVYCRAQQLSMRAKLELFVTICAAVNHAHQKLVVHRDLKPGNILVTPAGIPKLLDFGIAKLLDREEGGGGDEPLTLAGGLLMTPEYASPEQMTGGPITTAADIYALGVVLCELLTDRRPPRSSRVGSRSTAGTGNGNDVLAPSRLAPHLRSQLRGDLDSIVSLALRDDPQCRYESVQQLAADVKRYLEGRPVSAVGNALRYRGTKFVKRNKLGVGLAALAVPGLLAGFLISAWQWQVAQSERERAVQRYGEVRELANTIVFDLTAAVGDLPGSTRLRKALLDKGVTYLDRLAQDHSDDPELMRELGMAYHKLASVQGSPHTDNLGDTKHARESLRKSLAIREELVARDPTDVRSATEAAHSYEKLSALHGAAGELDEARSLTDRCVELMTKHLTAGQHQVRRKLQGCYATGAHWDGKAGDYASADRQLRKASELTPGLLDANPKRLPPRRRLRLARFHAQWAEVAANTGDKEGAVRHERRRLEILLTLPESKRRNRHLADAYHALAARLAAAGDTGGALEAYAQGLRRWKIGLAEYPDADDVRPRQGMAAIYAGLARLHANLAGGADQPATKSTHRAEACSYYRHSRGIIQQLPDAQAAFGIRYPWLQAPAQLMRRLARNCVQPAGGADVDAAKDGGDRAPLESSTAVAPPPEAGHRPFGLPVSPSARLPHRLSARGVTAAFTTGDLDTDGLLDAVVTRRDSKQRLVLVGEAGGTFQPPLATPQTPPQVDIKIVELDDDGVPDLATVVYGKGLSLSPGNGDGTFGATRVLPIKRLADVMFVGLDDDQHLDLVALRFGSNEILILLGDGFGGFERIEPVVVEEPPAAVTAGDLDGDGIPDLVVAAAEAARISVAFGNGDGTFAIGPITDVRYPHLHRTQRIRLPEAVARRHLALPLPRAGLNLAPIADAGEGRGEGQQQPVNGSVVLQKSGWLAQPTAG